MTNEEALDKLQRYCSYQDRCHQEVRSKLLSLKIYGNRLEEIMSELIKDKFLNEERFAINYARGKYRMKGWGKIKITNELKKRHLSEYLIRKAMKEIDKEGQYEQTLVCHLEKYLSSRKSKYDKYTLRRKVYAHGIRKGFEPAEINNALESLFLS